MRIIKPSIDIGGTEFQCMSRTVELIPGGFRTFCDREWTMSVEVEVTYGATGSWTVLDGFRDSIQTVVLSPSDGVVSVDNPVATLSANIPAIPFMSGATRGDRQTLTLDLIAESEPVITTV